MPEPEWQDAYPKPQSDPKAISPAELLHLLESADATNIVMIDLRRDDYEASSSRRTHR